MKKLNFIIGLLFCISMQLTYAQGGSGGGNGVKAKPTVPTPGKASETVKPAPAKTQPRSVKIAAKLPPKAN
jgi:hypothetical protein